MSARSPFHSRMRTFCRRAERDLTRERMLAVPHAPIVLTILAALVIERRPHPDSKRQRTRKMRDVALWNARHAATRQRRAAGRTR